MTKLKPWALGPFELIKHANDHLNGNADFDKRMALVGFDNAIESSIITFLTLNPLQRNGRQFQKVDVDQWLRSFHSKIEFFEHYVVSLLAQPMLVERDEIIFYHQLRNELYHNGNGFVPAEAHLDGIRTASLWIFSTLFNANAKELLTQDKTITELEAAKQATNLSSVTIFLETFISLKKTLDLFLETTGSSGESHPSTLTEVWKEAIKAYSDNLPEQYTSVVQEAENARNAIVDGKIFSDDLDSLQELSNKLDTISGNVDSRLRQYQVEIVENAIQATINALSPKGNRKAGIVWQTIGSGLGMSAVSYVLRARLLPTIRDNHVIVVVDRSELALQFYTLISDFSAQYEEGQIVFPESKNALSKAMESSEPKIIISTIQKFDLSQVATRKECLFVGYDLHAFYDNLTKVFPNSTYILFTSTPPLSNQLSFQLFGEVVGTYGFRQALDDGFIADFRIEEREIRGISDSNFFMTDGLLEQVDLSKTSENRYLSSEFLARAAQDIAQHFELRQKKWAGKGLIVTPNLTIANIFYDEVTAIKTDWYGSSETTGLIKVISSIEGPTQRAVLMRRFQEQSDPLSLIITTRNWILGIDNSVIHTVYVLSSLSSQLRYRLAGLVSRTHIGKEYGLIVDYMKNDWNLFS
ncbi:MAG TPA: type I restriction endonuclease subunit R [Leptolyngbyaceae cyanobacterium M33_DOE_097]|nr:type I restriction endonuclease subunit R [Leptolyngbyaceae cyanobacterium M33_DOE_097]